MQLLYQIMFNICNIDNTQSLLHSFAYIDQFCEQYWNDLVCQQMLQPEMMIRVRLGRRTPIAADSDMPRVGPGGRRELTMQFEMSAEVVGE